MRITINIETGNAAFEELGQAEQVARILEDIANKWRSFDRTGEVFDTTSRDANGNTVARVTVEASHE